VRRPSRLLVTWLSVLAIGSAVAGCGDHGDGLLKGKLDVGLTTTTGTTTCDAVVVAERAISEATFGATRADAATRAVIQQRFAELRASLPADLTDDVAALEASFERAWTTGDADAHDDDDADADDDADDAEADHAEDPFESSGYLTADQAIRRYADACAGPQSTGDPSRAPTTSELPPEAMTIPLPPGEPPAGAT